MKIHGFAAWDGLVSTRYADDVERLHYTFGFGGTPYSGGGQDARGALFAAYAAELRDTFRGLFDLPVREAWVEANELVEGPDVEWAYLRAGSESYHERLREEAPADPGSDPVRYTARGGC